MPYYLPFLPLKKVEPNLPLENLPLPLENVENVEKVDDDAYVHVIKKVKKENITPENIDEIMLCQIPNISSITAIALIQKFKTIHNLTLSIKENEDCLKDISYTNSKNQIRKINKTSLTNIIKFLKK